MSHTYNRVFGNMKRQVFGHCKHRSRLNQEAIIRCQFEIAAMFLNEALTRMEKR